MTETSKAALLLVFTMTVAGCKREARLRVEKPCAIVSQTEEPHGIYVEYTVRCLEYTGSVTVGGTTIPAEPAPPEPKNPGATHER